MPFSPVWDAVAAYFFTLASLSRVAAMIKAETQVEGWWKMEFIVLLTQLRNDRIIRAWRHESPTGTGRRKADFTIDLASTSTAIELKTALCGLQKGSLWKLPAYVVKWTPKTGQQTR